MSRIKQAIAAATAVLALSSGVALMAPVSAQAATVDNMMLCEPDIGWCFQTNPPYNPAFRHECQWDYNLNGNNLHSGMYYTGCDYWNHYIGTP